VAKGARQEGLVGQGCLARESAVKGGGEGRAQKRGQGTKREGGVGQEPGERCTSDGM